MGAPGPGLTSGSGLDFDEIEDAVPRQEFKTRSGNPETYEIDGVSYRVLNTSAGYREQGIASWYGGYFHGRTTSSGDIYDMYLMTAAHKSLPLPTYVRVTNLENGLAVVLRVNDRGPFVGDRIIDLSFTAATKLGMADSGTARVEVVALDPPARERAP
jgi:rare lipoprotein A